VRPSKVAELLNGASNQDGRLVTDDSADVG